MAARIYEDRYNYKHSIPDVSYKLIASALLDYSVSDRILRTEKEVSDLKKYRYPFRLNVVGRIQADWFLY